MKKAFILILVSLLFLSACRDPSIDEKILQKATETEEPITVDQMSRLFEYYGDYDAEVSYTPYDGADIEGIVSPMYSKIHNGRYYFTVKKRYETAHQQSSREIYAYISLGNGEKHYICSDTLCTHTEFDECKYLNLNGMPYFGEDNTFYLSFIDGFYTEKADKRLCILKIDPDNDKIETVYRCEGDPSESNIIILFLQGDQLYFHEIIYEETEENEKEYDDIYTLKILNLRTGKTKTLDTVSSEYVSSLTPIYMSRDICYFAACGKIFTSDLNFENEREIFVLGKNESMQSYYYDEKSGELYFNTWNETDSHGTVYRFDGEKTGVVNLPHENIFCFQLTNDKIYYSPYDPYEYGPGRRGGTVTNEISGKIYVTDRHNPVEATLIFDDGLDFSMNSSYTYLILGDHLYFDYMELLHENGEYWYSMASELKKVRINLTKHTVKYLCFD